MTQKEIRSDILLILQKSKLSRNFRVTDRHIDFLINQYRARGIREEFGRSGQIDNEWLQDFGQVFFTPVNSADDPNIPTTSLILGKLTIPQVVSLPNDKGVFRVSSTSKRKTFYPIAMARFFDLVGDSFLAKHDYVFRVGTALYTSPCIEQGSVTLILDNPLDGVVISTENIQPDDLTIGLQYEVISGQVTSNAIVYNQGATFTATATTFTGTGVVQFLNQKRPMTADDVYPMSFTLLEYVVMKILTQEFKIEPTEIADIKNDSQDQLALMQNGNK